MVRTANINDSCDAFVMRIANGRCYDAFMVCTANGSCCDTFVGALQKVAAVMLLWSRVANGSCDAFVVHIANGSYCDVFCGLHCKRYLLRCFCGGHCKW